jgi:hypothetical protein
MASAQSERYANKQEAAAAGDPAASAPSFTLPGAFQYNGKAISQSEADQRSLACNQEASGVECYDSLAELERANTAKASTARKTPRARSAACEDRGYLAVFKYAQTTPCQFTGSGWILTLFGRHAWYDLTGQYDNETSAYFMGNHTAGTCPSPPVGSGGGFPMTLASVATS